jgi:drug/metabolite transporter (DMT)-like permease
MSIGFTTSSIIHWENITSNISPVLIISVQELMVFLLGSVMVLWNKKNINLSHEVKAYFLPITEMSIVIFFAILFSLLGLKSTDPLVSSLLFLALPLLTISMGSLFFKEKMSLKNIIAIIIISVGAFLLHYSKMPIPI